MIKIKKPFTEIIDDRAYLKARVEVSEDTALRHLEMSKKKSNSIWLTNVDYPPKIWQNDDFCAFFSAQKEYEPYMCTTRSNAFVMGLLWYAMVNGSDISFEAPMSKRLYDGITKMLMPKLKEKGFSPIRLIGPVTDELLECKNGVVTGMSGGVDSNYTLMCYKGDDAPQGKKLTHLGIYEACYYLNSKRTYPDDVDAAYEAEDKIKKHIATRAKMIAKHNDLPLVHVRTNLDKDFYRGGYVYTAMYRFIACTLAFEHLYNTYISSSSGHKEGEMEVSLFVPTQHYEDLLCECLQTENFKYMTSDHDFRVTKLKALADNTDFQKTVSVCFNTGKNGENCTECYGCWKTILPLDFIGKLDNFKESFDVDKYYKNRKKVFEDFVTFSKRPEASSARATIKQLIDLANENPTEAGDLFKEIAGSN